MNKFELVDAYNQSDKLKVDNYFDDENELGISFIDNSDYAPNCFNFFMDIEQTKQLIEHLNKVVKAVEK